FSCVDRLLALFLGLRYRQTVTLKRIYIIVATFGVVSGVGALLFILDYRLTFWYSCAVIMSCLIISFASYTKIFYSLCHRRIQTQDRVQQQPRAPNALNIARYKKAVYNALWVQLALVICYVPYIVVAILIASSETHSSQLIVSSRIALVFVFFNSSLNPFLYCWKISETVCKIVAVSGGGTAQVLSYEFRHNPSFRLYFAMLFKENNTN
ncbi:hypothetical protein pdam_00023943, partial [Pocillopora damicornis]